MTQTRPFTMLAAAIFLAMALIHLYRLATHFQIIIGNHSIPMAMSWLGILIPGVFAVMLFREARR